MRAHQHGVACRRKRRGTVCRSVLGSGAISYTRELDIPAMRARQHAHMLGGDHHAAIHLVTLPIDPVRTIACVMHFFVGAPPPRLSDRADAFIQVTDDTWSFGLIDGSVRIGSRRAHRCHHLGGAGTRAQDKQECFLFIRPPVTMRARLESRQEVVIDEFP